MLIMIHVKEISPYLLMSQTLPADNSCVPERGKVWVWLPEVTSGPEATAGLWPMAPITEKQLTQGTAYS